LSRLRHNLELNRLTARVFPLALADCSGQAELSVGAYEHAGHNTLGAFAYQTEMEGKALVEVRRLDEVLNENPLTRLDIMKIDVEGAELRLLRGAVETLRKYRPWPAQVTIENCHDHASAENQVRRPSSEPPSLPGRPRGGGSPCASVRRGSTD
jgi:FkbM family methyltransferase